MPLIAGDTECTVGLSKRLRDAMLAEVSGAIDDEQLRQLAHAIAVAVVAEIQTNATVTIAGAVTACPAGAGTAAGTGTVA